MSARAELSLENQRWHEHGQQAATEGSPGTWVPPTCAYVVQPSLASAFVITATRPYSATLRA